MPQTTDPRREPWESYLTNEFKLVHKIPIQFISLPLFNFIHLYSSKETILLAQQQCSYYF